MTFFDRIDPALQLGLLAMLGVMSGVLAIGSAGAIAWGVSALAGTLLG